jgi:hypothetical protein
LESAVSAGANQWTRSAASNPPPPPLLRSAMLLLSGPKLCIPAPLFHLIKLHICAPLQRSAAVPARPPRDPPPPFFVSTWPEIAFNWIILFAPRRRRRRRFSPRQLSLHGDPLSLAANVCPLDGRTGEREREKERNPRVAHPPASALIIKVTSSIPLGTFFLRAH